MAKINTRFNVPPAPIGRIGLHDDWLLPVSRHLLVWGVSEYEVKDICYNDGLASARSKGRSDEHWRKEVNDAVVGAVKWLADRPWIRPGDRPGHYRRAEHSNWDYIQEKIALGNPYLDRRDNRPEYLPLDKLKQKRALTKYSRCRLDGLVRPKRIQELAWLFGEVDFNLCLAKKESWPLVRPISTWQPVWKDYQFIVPSPMLSIGDSGEAKHNLNVGQRMFQVIEFDSGTLDEQYRLLLWLMDHWPLAMIVYSGGKSLHGWFPCFHQTEYNITTFFQLASSIGADPMTRIPSQYVRLPGGWNLDKKKRQTVLMLDEQLVEEHNAIIREETL